MSSIKYFIKSSEETFHFIDVSVEINGIKDSSVNLQLPSWRPGRYELGNFAKNIRNFKISDSNGNPVNFIKKSKDSWLVSNGNRETLIISYEYYSAELNAGSSFSDNEMLYVNPVNCCLYIPERINENCSLELTIPEDFKIAAGTKPIKNVLSFENFHELADTPVICSKNLIHFDYYVYEFHFHVWIQGKCNPDIEKIRRDFSSFSQRQIDSFGELPVKEYHFLIHATIFSFYHGVEHQTSSVNVLGPAYEITNGRYVDLLGLCSHELYHSWNIKSIRPAELFPYDYSKENYFRTGYVAEGITTYLGDYFLFSSNVFGESQFLEEISAQLQKHMDNFGRKNYSVAESSFDTWLDGYTPGIPERKVSIYTEGCLLAMIADLLILKNSKNKFTIHHVMREMYNEFYKKNRGYTENDYKQLLEKYSGISFENYFTDLVNGTKSYLPLLSECLSYIGYEISGKGSSNFIEVNLGFKITEQADKTIVTLIYPGSDAQIAGISVNDQIVAVNEIAIKNDLHKWMSEIRTGEILFTIIRAGNKTEIMMKDTGKMWFKNYSIVSKNEKNESEKANSLAWLNPVF